MTTSWPTTPEPFDLDGRVAVITGAANGLGLAIAGHCARHRMKLVLADIDGEALHRAGASLAAETDCVWVRTDVRRRDDVNAVAERAYQAFGRVDVLFNNAGVVTTKPLMETSVHDWQWMIEVNLWSVIHGIAAFVPRMIDGGHEGRIVNTASAAGFLAEADLGAYSVSKHGVVALSEILHKELRDRRSLLGVTIIAPAFISTGITNCERVRPAELNDNGQTSAAVDAARARLEKAVRSGKLTPEDVAAMVLDGVRTRRLYVFSHDKIRAGIEARMDEIYAALDYRRDQRRLESQ